MATSSSDVVVVGAGNAALCAALAAREAGATVTVLECAPENERGGNTAFTAGAMRVVYRGVDDLKQLMPDLTEHDLAVTDFGAYTREDFYDDMARVTQYRADPDLVEVLVENSFDTLRWMRSLGVRFAPIYGRQAFEVDGRFTFWGGLAVETVGGGQGLVQSLVEACNRTGIEIRYETRATNLVVDSSGVAGVEVRHNGSRSLISSPNVVLASGGFEANSEWRARYLGPGWDLAKVRGSRFNTGDGIRMALEIGASSAGHWSGCHAVQWDRNAPEVGDLSVGDGFQKHSYPFGIVVNNGGQRFIDEGADFRNFTYAKYGQEILKQPGQVAWQVFDSQVAHLMRDEYRIREATTVKAESLKELARNMDGVEYSGFLDTVAEFNEAVDTKTPFDPNILDGRAAKALAVPKSNWANRLDSPPFEAFQVTCGITFTFGGLRVTGRAEVLDLDHQRIAGLYACGELVGGLFYFNYPGGAGLTAGSVFGRMAGAEAGRRAQGQDP